MVRAACLVAALAAIPIASEAQQPCTKDARAVVSEIYTRILERPYDEGGVVWVHMLDRGESSVRDIVGFIIKSPEYADRFLAGNRQSAIRNVYKHLLNRAPEAEDLETKVANALGGYNPVIDTVLMSGDYTQYAGDNGVPGSNTKYCDAVNQ
jgi:hypothetical protein